LTISNNKIGDYLKEQVPRKNYAALEKTRNWPFMYDLLNSHVEQVDLAHAKEVRAIANAAVKTDQIDASTMAHLARLNFLPKAYAAPQEVRDLRQQIRHWEWMINQHNEAKNRVHECWLATTLFHQSWICSAWQDRSIWTKC
jgi:hypothetical protein